MINGQESACRWTRDQLPLFADSHPGSSFPDAQRQRINQHVADCSACRDQLDRVRASLNALWSVGSRTHKPPQTASLWPVLKQRIENAPSRLAKPWNRQATVFAIAAICLATITGLVWQPWSTNDSAPVDGSPNIVDHAPAVPDAIPQTIASENQPLPDDRSKVTPVELNTASELANNREDTIPTQESNEPHPSERVEPASKSREAEGAGLSR